MRKIKAFVYAIMGLMMCWNTYQQGHLAISIAIAVFTLCAIAITLAAIGTRQITWDESGITIKKFPAAPRHIPWSHIEKIRVDHLGYHVRTKYTTFKISTKNMPNNLLEQIRASIKEKNH